MEQSAEFERLAMAELSAAQEAATEEARRTHLNQAAIYATESERVRRRLLEASAKNPWASGP